MSIAFRVDASSTIGSGHVMRCLTLATALSDAGVDSLFVSRELDGHLCDLIAERGFPVTRLPRRAQQKRPMTSAADDACAEPAHAAWLGVAWQEDAEQTLAAIVAGKDKPDCLVVDNYALDQRWEAAMRTAVGRIAAIDDLADRQHDCDLLIDQNLVARMYQRYAGKVPASCACLLGPEYALLQAAYAQLRDPRRLRQGAIRRVLIYFGGADSGGLTARSLAALLSLNRRDVEVDVVIAAGSPQEERLRTLAAGSGKVHLHRALATLAPLMAEADLAVGACGGSTWERFCMGLPALVITLAENQRPIAEELARRGLIHHLGDADSTDEQAIAEALRLQFEQGLDGAWSTACMQVCDGRGASRVRAALTVTAASAIQVRRAGLEDEARLLRWANDPGTRRNAFSVDPIPADSHKTWLRRRLADGEGCHFYIAQTTDGVALGQVRFERVREAAATAAWECHYALAPEFRRRRLAAPMLEAALQALRIDVGPAQVLGRVRETNQASCKVFESLQFSAADRAEGVVAYRREL